jgi:hypothetical protein
LVIENADLKSNAAYVKYQNLIKGIFTFDTLAVELLIFGCMICRTTVNDECV